MSGDNNLSFMYSFSVACNYVFDEDVSEQQKMAEKRAKSSKCTDLSCNIMNQLPSCVKQLNLKKEKIHGSTDNRTRELEVAIDPMENSSQGRIHETFHLSGNNNQENLHFFLHTLEQSKLNRWQRFRIKSEFPLSPWSLVINEGDKIQCQELRLMNDDSAGMDDTIKYLDFALKFVKAQKIWFDSRNRMEKSSFKKVFEFLMSAAACCKKIKLDFLGIDGTIEFLKNSIQDFLACNNPNLFVFKAKFMICAPEVDIDDWTSTSTGAAHFVEQHNNAYIYQFSHPLTAVVLQMTIYRENSGKNIEKIVFVRN